MTLRKLAPEEHGKTRRLWETVFAEDTPEFLDYYYSVKTKENEIYVIEKDGEIVSMLHLNPYQMRIGEECYQTHYIVAVATNVGYRKQGLMRRLLIHAMQVMEERGEPFTFLMPASEMIYKPFGFEVIYTQRRGLFSGKNVSVDRVDFVEAKVHDCANIASFANRFLGTYDVVTWRTDEYYKALLKEQASEQGGILTAKRDDEIVGVFCYAKGEKIEVREPLFCEKAIFERALYEIVGDETTEVFCTGIGNEEKPMIMAKILNPELASELKMRKVFLNEVV